MAFSSKARKAGASPAARRKAVATAARTRALKKKLGLSWRDKLPNSEVAVPVDALIAKREDAKPVRRVTRSRKELLPVNQFLATLIVDVALDVASRGGKLP